MHPLHRRVLGALAERPTKYLGVLELCELCAMDEVEVLDALRGLSTERLVSVAWARDDDQSRAKIVRAGRELAVRLELGLLR